LIQEKLSELLAVGVKCPTENSASIIEMPMQTQLFSHLNEYCCLHDGGTRWR
jgi:hypothetical protein